jgi:cardiolipin synthase
MAKSNNVVRHVPNFLSGLRLALAFALIPTLMNNNLPLSLAIFLGAAVSDFLDGYLARRWKVTSATGALLDPLADKLLMTISYAMLAVAGHMPLYLAATVIARDVLILLAVAICKQAIVSVSIEPLFSSKINTTLQLIFVIMTLSCKCFLINVPSLLVFCSAAVWLSTVVSGVEYLRKYYWIKDAIFKH